MWTSQRGAWQNMVTLTLELLQPHLSQALLAQSLGHFLTLAPPNRVLAGAQGMADIGVSDEHSQLGVGQRHQACLQGPGGMKLE